MEHFQYYRSLRFPYCQEVDCSREFTVIIDALLGVGARLSLYGEYRELLHWCNQEKNALRVAVDMPTGVLCRYRGCG